MSKRIALLLTAGAGLIAAAALASADEPAKAPASQRICRDTGRQLGSHIRATRRCRTAEQWRQEDEEKAHLPTGMQVTEGQSDGHPVRQPQ